LSAGLTKLIHRRTT